MGFLSASIMNRVYFISSLPNISQWTFLKMFFWGKCGAELLSMPCDPKQLPLSDVTLLSLAKKKKKMVTSLLLICDFPYSAIQLEENLFNGKGRTT